MIYKTACYSIRQRSTTFLVLLVYFVFFWAIRLIWIVNPDCSIHSIPISKEYLMLCQYNKCYMTADAASICFDFFLQSFFSLSLMRIPKQICSRGGLIFGNPYSCKTRLFEKCNNLALFYRSPD